MSTEEESPAPARAGLPIGLAPQIDPSAQLTLAASRDKRPPVSILLRPYQVEINQRTGDEFRSGARRVLIVSPTGSGKGLLVVYHAQRLAAAGKRVLVLAPTREIRDQLAAALTAAGVAHGLTAPGTVETEALVQVATVATMAQPKRRAQWAAWADWILGDEAHHFAARTWRRVVADQPRARVAGYSATPIRTDGAALGDMFDAMVIGPSVADLMVWGFLSQFAVFAPSAPDLARAGKRGGDFETCALRERMGAVVIGAAVREYLRLCPGVAAVAFCVDRQHGRAVEQAFVAAGVRAAFIDGDTPADERRAAIAALGDGGLDVLVNCGLVAEGVDIPAIGAVLLLRPTMSLALHLQQVERALRPAPGKARALILDFSANIERLGFPDEPRAWSLQGSMKPGRDNGDAPRARRCPCCSAMSRPAARECAECGADLRTARERREAEIALAEAKRCAEEDFVATLPRPHAVAWAGADFERLRLVARLQGLKPGWAHFQHQRALQAEARRHG
jgi:superfamily II DNA or RNA helicase